MKTARERQLVSPRLPWESSKLGLIIWKGKNLCGKALVCQPGSNPFCTKGCSSKVSSFQLPRRGCSLGIRVSKPVTAPDALLCKDLSIWNNEVPNSVERCGRRTSHQRPSSAVSVRSQFTELHHKFPCSLNGFKQEREWIFGIHDHTDRLGISRIASTKSASCGDSLVLRGHGVWVTLTHESGSHTEA